MKRRLAVSKAWSMLRTCSALVTLRQTALVMAVLLFLGGMHIASVDIRTAAARFVPDDYPAGLPEDRGIMCILSGRVFEGEVGQELHPLPGVTVELYGGNDPYPEPGVWVRSATTNDEGWYGLDVYEDDVFEFYHIRETNLRGYISVGATSVDGTVRTDDWIEYVIPLEGKTVTGNKFWDGRPEAETPTATPIEPTPCWMFQGRVYAGTVGDESHPLEGVEMTLYGGHNPYPDPGVFIRSTHTGSEGWYGLEVCEDDGAFEFYHIREMNPEGYDSVGATTVDGTVRTEDWIEYVIPLERKTLTGNMFWDGVPATDTPTSTPTGTQVPTHTATVTATGLPTATPPPTQTPTVTVAPPEEELPDLYVTDIRPEGDMICYQIWNVGEAEAPSGQYVALYVDGEYRESHLVDRPLGPDERRSGCFRQHGDCTPPSDTIMVWADHDDSVVESDETNNRREETWLCDAMPPEIISGPRVSDVTSHSAAVSWETNEESNSLVRYGRSAGAFGLEASDPVLRFEHQVILEGLEPSATYRLMVRSTDESGNSAASDVLRFETLPLPDDDDPIVTVLEPGLCRGWVTVRALATDDRGVERVEFYVGDELVFTDYSGVSAEYSFEWDTIAFPNGEIPLTAKVFDLAGRWSDAVRVADVANLFDASIPQVTIISPKADATVSGQITVTAMLTDDLGLGDAVFYVDGVKHSAWGLSGEEEHSTAHFVWDTTAVTQTHPYLAVKVWDAEGKTAVDALTVTVNNPPPPQQPKLIVKAHTLTRDSNYFTVKVTVQNVGGGTASELQIQDILTGFQAISDSASSYVYHSSFSPALQWGICHITYKQSIPKGESRTFTYKAAPVLSYPAWAKVAIGSPVRLSYKGPGGTNHYHDVKSPILVTTAGKLIKAAHADAIKQADYLIVTNPRLLYQHYYANEVDDLLSLMADLAVTKQGVLGYLDVHSKYMLRKLIEPWWWWGIGSSSFQATNWSWRLNSDFSKPLKGYMLIVGETEIVPAWFKSGLPVAWGDAKQTGTVNYSDHGYGDRWSTGVPDLIVGRLIGDSASTLAKPLHASLGVHKGSSGFNFDRDQALMISGPPIGPFVEYTSKISSTLAPDFQSEALHCNDRFKVTSFVRDYEAGDGLAVGDVMGTSKADIIVADKSAKKIYVYDATGAQQSEFAVSWWGGTKEDAFAVGNFLGTTKEQIILADSSANEISVVDYAGGLLGKLNWVSFDPYDGLALGQVLGDAKEEIIVAHQNTNQVRIYQPWFQAHQFSQPFEKWDGFAVGDVHPGVADEIVVADRSANEIVILSGGGVTLGSHKFKVVTTKGGKKLDWMDYVGEGTTLAVGNVFNASPHQILLAPAKNYDLVSTYMWNADKGELRSGAALPFDFDQYDGLATGDVTGHGLVEWLVADQDNHVRVFDTDWVRRVRQDLPGMVKGKDLIYWAGHGNKDLWDAAIDSYRTTQFPMDFDQHNPLIMTSSCLTGNYQDGGTNEHKNIAESFLDSGAAVYIGATQVTFYRCFPAAQTFFSETWQANLTIGEAFTDLERSGWKLDDDWKFYVWEHNIYGDPKFGKTSTSGSGEEGDRRLRADEPPPAVLQVKIPDYVVTTIDDLDRVEIPGGHVWYEEGELQVPYFATSIEYPEGYKIQEVLLSGQFGTQGTTGLNIPMTPMTLTNCTWEGVPYSGTVECWFPYEDYRWEVAENPDGTTTLTIIVYPFKYHPLTTDVVFHSEYHFDVEYAISPLRVGRLTTDKTVYEQGEAVMVDLAVRQTGEPQGVLVNALVKRYGSEETVDGLLLTTLHQMSGNASFAPEWDTSGHEPGIYVVEVTLENTGGILLDRRSTLLELGVLSGEITRFSATPPYFDIGDTVTASLTFQNTGTVDVSGTALIRIRDEGGTVVQEFSHDITDLAPGDAVQFDDAWDTSGAEEGSYTLVGYVSYGSMTTDLKTATVQTGEPAARLYLPIITKSYL